MHGGERTGEGVIQSVLFCSVHTCLHHVCMFMDLYVGEGNKVGVKDNIWAGELDYEPGVQAYSKWKRLQKRKVECKVGREIRILFKPSVTLAISSPKFLLSCHQSSVLLLIGIGRKNLLPLVLTSLYLHCPLEHKAIVKIFLVAPDSLRVGSRSGKVFPQVTWG